MPTVIIALAVVVALLGLSLLWSGPLYNVHLVTRVYAFLLGLATVLGLSSWLSYQAQGALPVLTTAIFAGVVLVLVISVLLHRREL